ncbi:MAG: carbohydrate ABC transporter permease [Proteobacteria bacterium]|nr:carbohydrate ABC transporter permease [Pseudomonadota bacterium]
MFSFSNIWRFLSNTRGRNRLDWADILSYGFLLTGVLMILLPVFWMFMSSIKSEGALLANDPRLLPYDHMKIVAEGHKRPLSLFTLEKPDGSKEEVAFVRAKGQKAVVIRPDDPTREFEVTRSRLIKKEAVVPHWENYTDPTLGTSLSIFNFPRYFFNSVFVTTVATALTLLINAMAAFALSKYRFTGQKAAILIIIATLLIPPTVILVPLFIVVKYFGMFNSLWGVIIPGAATPTGVFLLRQYMLTIPDELLEAARMDAASEWKIFWRIVFPLSLPAIAVLAILSVIWRWNDFLWPLIVLTHNEVYTLQIGLSTFKGELNDNTHYLLAMTVLTLLPVTAVFAFLQKYITTGIASTGMK